MPVWALPVWHRIHLAASFVSIFKVATIFKSEEPTPAAREMGPQTQMPPECLSGIRRVQSRSFAPVLFAEWTAEAMPLRRVILATLLVLVIVAGWMWGRRARQSVSAPGQIADASAITIDKQPELFANRTFDPANPPPDMPPLPYGEQAECDSNFTSDASVGGSTRKTDATHGVVTITRVKMTLGLKVNIWTPPDATPQVVAHEQGHRQISEYYYQGADQLARQVAAGYLGSQVATSGADLDAEANKALEKAASDITGEYSKELDPGPTQNYYDTATDHARNGVAAQDAVATAIRNNTGGSAPPAPPGN